MPVQYCFLPKAARESGDATHRISSAALRADDSIVVEVAGSITEIISLPGRPQQIALCNSGLYCLDELGLLYHWQGVTAARQWLRQSSLPDNAAIASISCFEDGALFVVTEDAVALVYESATGDWRTQTTDLVTTEFTPASSKHSGSETQDDLESKSGSRIRSKRRFRFSVRTMLLMMLALALLLGPVSYWWTAHKTRIAVDILEAQGNQIQFAHQFDSAGKAHSRSLKRLSRSGSTACLDQATYAPCCQIPTGRNRVHEQYSCARRRSVR